MNKDQLEQLLSLAAAYGENMHACGEMKAIDEELSDEHAEAAQNDWSDFKKLATRIMKENHA